MSLPSSRMENTGRDSTISEVYLENQSVHKLLDWKEIH